MKKLFSTILVLCFLLSGNAYAELLRLACVAADKTMTTNVLIDMDGKETASVQGYVAKVKVTPSKFFLEYSFANINVLYYIDRNSGIYNETWISQKTKEASYYNGTCSVAKKKF